MQKFKVVDFLRQFSKIAKGMVKHGDIVCVNKNVFFAMTLEDYEKSIVNAYQTLPPLLLPPPPEGLFGKGMKDLENEKNHKIEIWYDKHLGIKTTKIIVSEEKYSLEDKCKDRDGIKFTEMTWQEVMEKFPKTSNNEK